MNDFDRLRGDYLAHVEEAHKCERSIAGWRDKLQADEAEIIEIEDRIERAVDAEGQPIVQGKNAEQRAAHKRQLCADDNRWLASYDDARQLRLTIAKEVADMHLAERLLRLARQEGDWLIAMAKREVTA